MTPGKFYLLHPDSFATTKGRLEHPAGTAVSDFSGHMRAWCRKHMGLHDVPEEFLILGDTLKKLENAKAVFTPKNNSVVLVVTVGRDEVFRGPVFYEGDDSDWFAVGVRMACGTIRGQQL